MTTKRIFVAALAALFMTAFNACTKEEAPAAPEVPGVDETLVEMTLTAVQAADESAAEPDAEPSQAAVKSTFDGVQIGWEADDLVAIYDGTAKRQFTVASVDNGVATLKGMVAPEATEFYAVFPYSAAGDALPTQEGLVSLNMPAVQTLASGKNFAEDAMVTVGKVQDGNVVLKNVVSLLKLDIPEGVASVRLQGFAYENISGGVTASADAVAGKAASSSVTLMPSGETFAAGVHYIALLPTKFTAGFKVVYSKTGQMAVIKTTNEVEFPRKGGFDVTASTANLTWLANPIMTEEELLTYVANQSAYAGETAKLGANIALTKAWTPVALTGTFDGQNNTISGVNVEAVDNAGMFSLIDTDASLKNVTIEGTIKQTSASADQKGAGLAAELKGTMYKVINKTNVESVAGKWVHVGGLVGNIKGGSVVECDNQGTVILNGTAGDSRAGGVFGFMNSGVVQDCTNSGMVTSNLASAEGFGGIGGLQQGGNVQSCTNTGSVVVNAAAANSYAGGVVGYVQNRSKQKLTISGCVNNGEISGADKLKAIGGIVGVIHRYCTSSSEIIGCTNEKPMTAEITKTEFYLGGIVGRMANPGDLTAVGNYVNYIKNNISSGNVSVIKSNAAQTSALFVGGVLGVALGNVEVEGNQTLAGSVYLEDGYSNNDCANVGGIIGRIDKITNDTSTHQMKMSSNINEATVNGNSVRTNNYVILSGGLVGLCKIALVSSKNKNFGDVAVANHNSATDANKNPFAGGLVGKLDIGSGVTAQFTGDMMFGYVQSDCGRAGLICGVASSGEVTLQDCVVGGKLNCPTNKYIAKEINADNFDDNPNMLISYYKNATFSQAGTTFGKASDYESK